MISPEQFWYTFGAKFIGDEANWEDVYTGCDKQHAWTDEEGCFNKFLCCVDWKECDKKCLNHHVKINPEIEEFVNELNKRLK